MTDLPALLQTLSATADAYISSGFKWEALKTELRRDGYISTVIDHTQSASPQNIRAVLDYVEELRRENEGLRAQMARDWKPTHRHIKRGSEYQRVTRALLQTSRHLEDNDLMEIYLGADGQHWVRPYDEFHDGRFEALPPAPKDDA